MLEFLAAPQNLPFTVALCVMLGIAILEGVGTLLGAGLSSLLDSLVGEIDFDVDADADVDADVHGPGHVGGGLFTGLLGWLRFGRVPVLVLLVIFLVAFGLAGLVLQGVLHGATGWLLPASVAWLPAFAAALPTVRGLGGLVARVMPKEETSAVSRQSFVGRIAVIVLGTSRRGEPAQARLRDQHGRTHYIMVEPQEDRDEFEAGTQVLLVQVVGPRFRAIRPPSEALIDGDPE